MSVENKYNLDYYKSKKLPTRLEVKSVIYKELGVFCELWYSKSNIEAAKLSGVKLL